MTDEEMRQTVQFTLTEQAKVTAGLRQVTEHTTRLQQGLEQVTENTAQLQRMMLSMTELFNRERKDLREKIAALTDAQIQAEAEMKDFRAEMRGFSAEMREFRFNVGQMLTMLENSQDKLAAAMIEGQQRQARLEAVLADTQQSQAEMRQAMAELARVTAQHSRRLDSLER
jgi:chromosome segregation ATPase